MDTTLTIISFVFFTGLVGALTYYLTRGDNHESSEGYFLAGRSLTGGVIAGSLMLTNLSTEQLVGLNADAYKDGICVMAWEVLAAVALVIMALFFLPRFLKSGIATVPQYLEQRFDAGARTITTLIFIIAYAGILLPIILYTGAVALGGILNIQEIIGVTSDTTVLWLTVWLVGILGSIYAIFGGLRTVAVSDTINGFGLLVGGLMIAYFGLHAVAGEGGSLADGWHTLVTENPEKFNSIGGSKQSVPFFTLFTGVALLNLFYWCTNQQIIQRTFGASSLKEGQKGVLYAGFLKVLGPIILVMPGVIAFHLYSGEDLLPVKAYGTLVRDVLPKPLAGFFAAAMVGAILSSFNSALNSTATLFSLGVYQPYLNPNATQKQVVSSGKWFGVAIAILAMSTAPLLVEQKSIFGYLQKMNGLYFIPIFSVVLVGMLSKRVPAIAAKIALVVGFTAIALGYFVYDDWVAKIHEFHFLGLVFACLVALMLLIGKINPRAEAYVQQDSGAVDLTPWVGAKPAGLALVLFVLGLYLYFADFSILGSSN